MLNLADHAYGLDFEPAIRLNEMIRERYPNLSVRRIPESDPFFTPEKPWGIWEDTAITLGTGQSNWVFALSPYSLDHRVLARLYENDLSRGVVANRKWEALAAAENDARQKLWQEQQDQRKDEMLGFLMAARHRNYVRMTVDGDKLRIGDGPAERTRTFIV
jgi:hypothetical protein